MSDASPELCTGFDFVYFISISCVSLFNSTENLWLIDWFIHCSAFWGIEGHVALDRNPKPGYNTILLRLIPGDLVYACPHIQFHTLSSLLDSQSAVSNSYPNVFLPRREAVCIMFMMVFGMTRLGRGPATYHIGGGHANH